MFMESALFIHWDGIKLGTLNKQNKKYVYILCSDCQHHWGNLKCRKETEMIPQQCSAPFWKVAHRIGLECSSQPMIWRPLAAGLQCGMGLGCGSEVTTNEMVTAAMWNMGLGCGSEVPTNDLATAAVWNGSWMWLRGAYQWYGDSCNVEYGSWMWFRGAYQWSGNSCNVE